MSFEGIERFFIDGNNMMMIDETLRELFLAKKIKQVEHKLAELIKAYALK